MKDTEFVVTDKGERYIERLRQVSQEEISRDRNKQYDVIVLAAINYVDSYVFRVLKEEDFRPTVEHLLENNYIEEI